MLYIIVNPASKSGMGKRKWEAFKEKLNQNSIVYEVFFTDKQNGATKCAKEVLEKMGSGSSDVLCVLGGDGTINETVNALNGTENITLAYLPTGSSNDLARDMGISTKVEEALLPFLGAGKECRMDLGSVSWSGDGVRRVRRFLVGCGIGYDAEVCAEALSSKMKRYLNRVGLGKLTYLGIGLKQMLAVRYARVSVRLDGKEILHLPRMLFVVCMLHRYEGGGSFRSSYLSR